MSEENNVIADCLRKLKFTLRISNKNFTKFIQDEPDVINGLEKIANREIPLSILYQLSWYANLKWRECCDSTQENKVERVKVARDLRDACDYEIMRRLKL